MEAFGEAESQSSRFSSNNTMNNFRPFLVADLLQRILGSFLALSL